MRPISPPMAWLGRSKPYDRNRLLAEAARARTKGKTKKALALLETVLEHEPSNAELHRRAAPLLAGSQRMADAWTSYRIAVASLGAVTPASRTAASSPSVAAVLGTPPYPDGVVVIESDRRSCVICLEIDEATQRRAVIEAKLNGYRRVLDAYPTWWLLFVVPSRTRARWLRSVAGQADGSVVARTWVTTLAALRLRHLDASLRALADGQTSTLRALARTIDDRRAGSPVASEPWLRLLGEGGVEELGGIELLSDSSV